MTYLKLLKEVKSLPKLSLASSHLEYFDWEESMENFFQGHRLQQSEIYYAEQTLAKDVLHWWIHYDKNFPCWTWSDMKVVLHGLFLSLFWSRKMVAAACGSKYLTTKPIDSSKQLKKADSQLLQKAVVPEPTAYLGVLIFL